MKARKATGLGCFVYQLGGWTGPVVEIIFEGGYTKLLSHHIDAIITEAEGSLQWRFTRFYGEPETGKKRESWRLLEHLSGCLNLPWVVMGDFNEIIFAKENLGGNLRPEWQMNQFC